MENTMDTKQIWESCLNDIQIQVSQANFSTWFGNTYLLKEDQGIVSVVVPNEFVKDWLLNKYNKLIMKSLGDRLGSIRAVEYIVSKNAPQTKTFAPVKERRDKEVFVPRESLPLENFYVNKEDN